MTDAPEFSLRVEIDEIPHKGLRKKLDATEEERAALAQRFGLLSLTRFSGRIELRPLAGGPLIRVEGLLSAELEQACVVSGEPVTDDLEIEIGMEFAPPGMIDENIELTLADADPPEPIEGGAIDLGEIAAQQLALALNPYPRKEGANFDTVLDDLPEGRKSAIDRSEPENPFAKLAALKGKPED